MANCCCWSADFPIWRALPPACGASLPAPIRPGHRIDGAVIFESDASQQIDNMEGLAVHREGRDTVLTMVSDDNFNGIQRTLLLEFALAELTDRHSGPLGGRAPHDHQDRPVGRDGKGCEQRA